MAEESTTTGIKAESLVKKMRTKLGDTDCSIPEAQLLDFLDEALQYMALSKDLACLFTKRASLQNKHFDSSGNYASSWYLPDDVLKVISIDLLDLSKSPPVKIPTCIVSESELLSSCPMPELNEPGLPGNIAISTDGAKPRMTFDKPSDRLIGAVISYRCCPSGIDSMDSVVDLPKVYCSFLVRLAIVYHKKESSAYDQARADYEDIDLMFNEIAELVNASNPVEGTRHFGKVFCG